jgi:hypothetical protein
VNGKVSICEFSINIVSRDKPKMLRGLSQKALWEVLGLRNPLAWARIPTGEERGPKPFWSIQRNAVSLYRSPHSG